MSKSLALAFNADYGDEAKYPTQHEKLKRIVDDMKTIGVNATPMDILVRGNNNNEVISNIARQIRDNSLMRALFEEDAEVVSFFGDSAGGTFLSAISKNLDDDPVSADLTLKPRPVLVGDGGTLNLLARHLGTADSKTIRKIINGEVPYEEQDLRVREVTVSTFDERGQMIDTQISPWTCFVGTGLDAFAIGEMERLPRTVHPALRGLKVTKKILEKIINNDDDRKYPLGLDSYTVLPKWAFFRFGKEFDCLGEEDFHHISFKCESGWEAMKRFVIYNSVGYVPKWSSKIWEGVSDDREELSRADLGYVRYVLNEIKPRKVRDPSLIVDGRDNMIHIDGYPIDLARQMGMPQNGHAEMDFKTTDQVIKVVRKK